MYNLTKEEAKKLYEKLKDLDPRDVEAQTGIHLFELAKLARDEGNNNDQ